MIFEFQIKFSKLKNTTKIHTCSQDGDPWAWNQINRWWFQILNAENIRFRPGIDKNCQNSKNVKKVVSTDLPDFKSWRKSLVVQKSNQVQISGLRFYVLTVMCFNRLLPHEYHTNWTTKPLMGVFFGRVSKARNSFFNFHRFLKVISKLSKGL